MTITAVATHGTAPACRALVASDGVDSQWITRTNSSAEGGPGEAESRARGASARGVSGGELAWALRRIGLHARLGGPDHVVLMRGRSALAIVPLQDELHPATVRSLLRTLGITPEQLDALLAQP